MAETTFHVSRRMALDGMEAMRLAGATSGAVDIRLSAPRARFSLRLEPSLLSTTAQVTGFTLDMPINRRAATGEKAAMRLGPDEWLLSGPEGEAAQIAVDVGVALAGLHHSLVDVGHHYVVLSVSRPRAADVINSGCPLDLSPAAFRVGQATRTLLGKAEVILAKTEDLAAFEIACGRSFVAYVHEFLLEAARELRVRP
jgi:sarcosine oxidase, subunit gamma